MPRRRRPKPRRQYCKFPGGELKVIFPTELDVKLELVNHARFDTDSRPYKCKFGNHYHISTQQKRESN